MSDNPEEAAYYLRIISFFIDVTTDTVLKVVYYHTKPDIVSYLHSDDTKAILSQLLKDKVLVKQQYHLLSAPVPNPKNFDLSLLITLLRSTDLLPPPKQGWGSRPGQSDLTLPADILRLRNIRNSLVGHRPKAALYKAKFERLWKEIEEVLLRIHIVVAPGTETELIEKFEWYRSRRLDACNGQEYLQKLEEWWNTCEEISKLQEKVENLVQKCNEFALFFRDKPKKYSRYVRLLFEGGRLVLSNVLTKQILEQGYDLHTILLEKQDLLESRIANQEMLEQIFPTDSTDAVRVNIDTDSWDILVLAHVIDTILIAKNTRAINMIKDARKNYADTALMSLHDDDRFSSCCEDLVYSIRMLSLSLDEDIQNKCEEQIDKYRSTTTADPTTDSDDYLGQLKAHGLGIKNLSDLYIETMEKLKKSVQEMENAGLCFKNEHVLELKMVTLGESSEKKKVAEDTLHTVWQAALRRSEDPEEFEVVRLEVDKILEEIQKISDVKATDIKRHCILFSLTCYSCQGLVQAIDYLTCERFEEHIATLARELGIIYNAVIKIEGHITFESLHKILENPQCCTDGKDQGLNLPIICSSPQGMREVLKLLGNEKTTNSINQIADVLSVQVEETISLKLIPDPKGFTGVFDETDSETSSSSGSHVDEVEYSDRYMSKQSRNLTDTYSKKKHDEDDPDREEMLKGCVCSVEKEMIPENNRSGASDQDLKRDLQRDLIVLYRKKHTALPIDFITEDINMPFGRLYVPPYPLYSVDTSRKNIKAVLQEKELKSLHELFLNEGKACRNIYLTAETGMGKTAFVKWLALSWCQAHEFQEEAVDKYKEKDEMKTFQFLFLVPVGETRSDEYHIDKMIYDNIIRILGESRNYNRKDLERILETEDSLIILDGIDESIVFGDMIPSKTEREKSTILTTCTTWTFERLGLTSAQIDKHVKIGQLESSSMEILSQNIISLFIDEASGIAIDSFSETLTKRLLNSTGSAYEQFKKMLQEKKIDHLIRSPVVLAHVLSLWIFEEDAGKSLCDVYTRMISLLVARASQKKAFGRQLSKFKTHGRKAVEQFDASCQPYDKLYIKLGILAFHTLFSKDMKRHFEFDEAEARQILSSDEETEQSDVLEAGFITGILCRRSLSKYLRKKCSISFLHQKVHQYLAAMYINSVSTSGTTKQIIDICTTISAILEVADVFIFLSGLNPDVARNILEQIQPVFAECKEKHRRAISSTYPNHIKNIQDMIVCCVEESRNSARGCLDLALEDVVVDPSCNSDSYKTHLKRLVRLNRNNIQSLHVEDSLPRRPRKEMLLFLQQVDFPKLQKLRIVGVSVLQNYTQIQDYKGLRNVHLEQMFFESESTSWKIFLSIIQQPILQALGLESLCITHKQLSDIVRCITDNTNLTQILLRQIQCTSDLDSCSGVVLDMSCHEKLHRLELVDVPVTEVKVNANCLEECQIGNLPDNSALVIFRSLKESPHLSRLICSGLSAADDISMLTHVLPELENLVYIDLSFIEFGQSLIHLSSEMTQLETLKLLYVSLSAMALQGLVELVETYPQAMTVELEMCSVEPEEEFKRVKRYIGSSPKLNILHDVIDDDYIKLTIKTNPSA